jgi:acetoin utilization protein AcuC
LFNDAAVAVRILRERFDRVAYVDIDVHHGDGVQGLFLDDPTVLTCSIHEDPRTLFPGTGFLEETGAEFTSVNAPVPAGSTGDAWLAAFDGIVMPALERFRPQAIVLQMGTDAHELDPLAHLRVTAQEWREAVCRIRDFGAPIVALGGGGYNLLTVPRMWVGACLELSRLPVPERLPEDLAEAWQTPRFDDLHLPAPRGAGTGEVRKLVARFQAEILPRIPASS